jgi:hypothetical protein
MRWAVQHDGSVGRPFTGGTERSVDVLGMSQVKVLCLQVETLRGLFRLLGCLCVAGNGNGTENRLDRCRSP